ncbi:MAG: SHD1 domain-containing protein [Planctomycetota bacterium]|nr:SHD1 domain-containing protein [Planctomycetota bacterium]
MPRLEIQIFCGSDDVIKLTNRCFSDPLVRLASAARGPGLLCLCSFVCLAGLLLNLGAELAQADTWVDSTGKHKTDAEFLGVKAGKVYLKKTADGTTIAVPFNQLNAESQQLARKLHAASLGATPGAAADTPDAAARALIAALEVGQLRGVWDALPPSYQKDINDLVHAFATNMDIELWKGGTGIVNKAEQILETKKTFILNHPAVAPMADKLTPNYDEIVAVLKAIVTSELMDLSKLKNIDVGAFLDGSGKKIMDKLAALAKAAEQAGVTKESFGVPVPYLRDLKKVKYTTVSVDGDTAKLRIEEEGKQTTEQEAIRVEGKWLPKEMAAGWAEEIAAGKAKLAELGPALKQKKKDVIGGMTFANLILAGLLAAKTQEDFNQAIDTLKNLAGGALGGGPGGPSGSIPGAPGGGGPGPKTAAKPEPLDDLFGIPPAKPGAAPKAKPGAKPAADADPFG